jgi:glucose dehydrogenase
VDLRRLACLSLLPLVLAVAHVTRESGAPSRATTQTGAGALTEWPEFGLDPQRSDATEASTGITAANVGKLHDRHVTLPGTIDSSPIYLSGAQVRGGTHDVAIVTSSYGRTFALDATTGKRLWTYTPPGYSSWVGTPQITNTSPLLDPDPAHR